jgi:cyclopropane fatty-acyl-phospholipid synthase-like methyltransferase
MFEKFLNREIFDKNLLKIIVTAGRENNENYGSVKNEIEQIKNYFKNLKLEEKDLLNSTMLDIGSGTIRFDKYVQAKYKTEVYSLDLDRESLGNEHLHEIMCRVGSEKIDLPDNMFEIIISHGALPENLVKINKENDTIDEMVSKEKLDLFFDEIYRTLKPNGKIKISIASAKYIDNLIYKEKEFNYKKEHIFYKYKDIFIREYLKNKYKDKFKIINIDKNDELIVIEK